MSSTAPTVPSKKATEQAHAALEALRALPSRRGARDIRVATKQGKPVEVTVPREAFDLFMEILGQLASGHAVTIVPVHGELTTQQAAELLNISRPYLIRLLDDGKIPYSKVGTHRRLRVADVAAYKAQRDAEHAEAQRELTREAQKLKLGC